MKSLFFLSVVLIFFALPLMADNHKMSYGSQEGTWNVAGNRYIQIDQEAPRAKAWVNAPQSRDMVYKFAIRYEGGGEDGHGGVGLHILADTKIEEGISWGLSDSWLLWLNYDESPAHSKIPSGLSAQVYKSRNDSNMDLIASISLKDYENLLMRNLNSEIPINIRYYSRNGRVTISDPSGKTMGWYVDLPDAKGETGSFVAARTNGLSVSFTSPHL